MSEDFKKFVLDSVGKDILQAEDGYYIFWPDTNGSYSPCALRIIVDELDRLNEDWDKEVKAMLERLNPEKDEQS